MSDKRNFRVDDAVAAVKRGAEATANSINQVSRFVARNDSQVAEGISVVISVVTLR